MREAATRVFSNASGSYSSNINLAVENSSWSDEMQLQEMYASRKSFAFDSDRRGPVTGSWPCSPVACAVHAAPAATAAAADAAALLHV